jgi:capsular exopolysaccharide synthesis family protein
MKKTTRKGQENGEKPRSRRNNLIRDYNAEAPYVTEVRRLLQTLLREGKRDGRKVYLLTSASRGEGKSTISGLLAIGAARFFGQKTLLIDGDPRRPTQHQLFDVSKKPGLFEVLHGRSSLESAVRPTAIPTLSVMTSGDSTGPDSEAYRDDAFARLVRRVRDEYDLVIVDSPPIVPVAEPLMMSEHVDGVLLVVMAGKTPVNLIRRMKQIIEPVSTKVVGVVLNNALDGLPYYYDYRYYGYRQSGPSRIRKQHPDAGVAAPAAVEPEKAPAAEAAPEKEGTHGGL